MPAPDHAADCRYSGCRLVKIQEVAGSKAPTREIMDKLMAGDFDPEQFDAAMASAFGDDYYVSHSSHWLTFRRPSMQTLGIAMMHLCLARSLPCLEPLISVWHMHEPSCISLGRSDTSSARNDYRAATNGKQYHVAAGG